MYLQHYRFLLLSRPLKPHNTQSGQNILQILTDKNNSEKAFEGEITTLLQTFCELSLNSKFISKSRRVAGDTF